MKRKNGMGPWVRKVVEETRNYEKAESKRIILSDGVLELRGKPLKVMT